MPQEAKEYLLKAAARLGLDCVGTVALPLDPGLTARLAAETAPCPFTPTDIAARTNPEALLPGARSVIVILFPYRPANDTPLPPAIPDTPRPDPRANIARYARARDYHLIVRQYLDRLIARLAAHHPDADFYPFADTSPLPDRYLAYAAGLGYFGLNRCLINDRYGSYIVIGGIITTLAYPPDAPLRRTCLGCRRCYRACPGHALSDAAYHYARCKSYLTQKKGELNAEEIAIIRGNPLLFGCDTCQDVCPHNAQAAPSPLPEFADERILRLTAAALAPLSNRQFRAQYGDRAFAWRGKSILLRNAQLLGE